MKDLLEMLKKQLAKEETKRYLKFLALPLAVVVLIAVIVIADKPAKQKKSQNTEETSAWAGESTGGEEMGESQTEAAEYILSEEEMPEITELMEKYLAARKTCDRDGISTAYAGTYSGEELDVLMAKLEEEVKFYQDFQNVSCRTVKVPGTTDRIVYARFDIKFRQAETMAPTMIVCYVKQAADGNCYLEGALTEEESAAIETSNRTDAVQAQAKEVNGQLRSVLEADANLLSVYNTLTGRGPEGGTQEESAPAQVQIADPTDGETEAGTDAADDETEVGTDAGDGETAEETTAAAQ